MKNKVVALVILCMSWLPAFAAPLRVTQVTVENVDHQVTRILFEVSALNPPKVFTLSHPDRLVVDFADARLLTDVKSVVIPNSVLKTIRVGHPVPGTLRFVFDVNAQLHYKLFSDGDRQIGVDVTTAAQEKIAEKPVTNGPAMSAPQIEPLQKAVPVKVTQKVIPNDNKTAITKPAPHRIVIVIDPGHGGKDPGAIGTMGTSEKNVVLGIAKQLAELINHQPNMHAVLTRNGDYFVALRDRIALARKGKADLFISIHADSFLENKSEGVSIYALSRRGATSEAARWLAKRENYSELGGVNLTGLDDQSHFLRSVLIDLAQTATTRDSLLLGNSLLDALDNVTTLHYTHVEQAPFVVLKSPDIPSVLVETGFISNGSEEKRLRDVNYQNKIAVALFTGVKTYLKKYPITS